MVGWPGFCTPVSMHLAKVMPLDVVFCESRLNMSSVSTLDMMLECSDAPLGLWCSLTFTLLMPTSTS